MGYLIGKIRIGKFVLGGIAGTLLVGVVIGQIGITIDPGIKTIFFALFIYAVGFQGGPQFFHALNRRSLNQLASAFVMCLMGLITVLVGAWMFGLDRGLAAGLASGGLTQSAIIGTAGDAIAKLGLSAAVTKTMQTNVAVGYAVTYIFGSLGPIILVTWLLPALKRWDIRAEAIKLAASMSGGRTELGPGQFDAVRPVVTRFFAVGAKSEAAGKTALEVDTALSDDAVEAIIRSGGTIDLAESATRSWRVATLCQRRNSAPRTGARVGSTGTG
ncbi:AspT/YidE/YbjL antiporter-like protein [Cryobacterium psychrotolerans]|nr:AspT/YidE/YbjL antiporter-like protein [Cryobacterium psychrotolerans]